MKLALGSGTNKQSGCTYLGFLLQNFLVILSTSREGNGLDVMRLHWDDFKRLYYPGLD